MDEIRRASKKLKAAHETFNAEYEQFVDRLGQEEKRIEKRYDSLKDKQRESREEHGDPTASENDVIEINAGGKIIAAKRGALCQINDTRLEALFSGRWDKKLQRDSHGRIFLDINPKAFQAIVDYLNEMAISPLDNPPQYPTSGGESQFMVDQLLDLFTLRDPNQFDSNIIHDDDHIEILHDWLEEDGHDGKFQLLYCSSRDGKSASDFHLKCDNKGSTLTIVETTCGEILGGYSNIPWASVSRNYSARKAFLFHLSGHGVLRKKRLKNPNDCRAVIHNPNLGPVFGGRGDGVGIGHDLEVDESTLLISPFSYETGPALFGRYTIKEVEVFGVNETQDRGTKKMNIQKATSFTITINDALNTKLGTLKEAEKKITALENLFTDEAKFVDSFLSGESKDVVMLNVSGTKMATKRSTLMVFEESVLAQQFDDLKWTEQGHVGNARTKEWTPDDVFSWAKNIDDISDDVASIFLENQITGNELLALEKDGLEMLGINRTGTMCLLLKEIKNLEKSNQDAATLIEHSPYCFGKILDYLRMKKLHLLDLGDDPDLPVVHEEERCRFEKVVKYFFPGESSELILGKGLPISIHMARTALCDPEGSGEDFLRDGRKLHIVRIVAAVRAYENYSDHVLISVEDGTGCVQVEMRLDQENGQLASDEDCKEQTYVQIVGQVEEFGGERRILASSVRPVSSGNDLTNHFFEVAQSYDKYLQLKQQGKTKEGISDTIRAVVPIASPHVGQQIQPSGQGAGVGLARRESMLRSIIRSVVQSLGRTRERGGHVRDIAQITYRTGRFRQQPQLIFSEDEIRRMIRTLSNEGLIYSTVDEDHYQHAL